MRTSKKHLAGVMAALAVTLPAGAAEWKPADWAPIKENDLKIVAGSPLDFSGLLPAGTVATNGPVINNNGRLVFQNFPDEKARLNCASLAWSPATGSFPDEATATAFVAQLRRHGYNVVRFHYVEGILMHKVQVDNQVNEVQLARFHGLLNTQELIDAHSYTEEVSLSSTGTGTTNQNSQTDTPEINLATRLAAVRHANKPFIVTEYGQPFWNKYRFEASVTVPAVAALQNWDMICMHGEGGIDLSFDQPGISRKQAINPYGVGIDPVLRAGETLSALLFLRGDVAPSPNRVRISIRRPRVKGKWMFPMLYCPICVSSAS